jgi:aromatic-L-amino-acid decarboxylase
MGDKEIRMDNQSFRDFGYRCVDWIADYLENVGGFPVRPAVKPGEIKSRLPADPPLKGESMDRILEDFQNVILPGVTHWQHPMWFAYFMSNNSPPSILAEMLTAGMNSLCMIWETCPAGTELEERVLEWLRLMTGLPEGMTGVIQDNASVSTLVALLSAREKSTGFQANEMGIKEPLVVYMSEEAHSSVEKGIKIAGFGRRNIRTISTDSAFALVPEELEQAIGEDKNRGLKPCCVVGTLGTTSSSALDPVREIGEICRRHSLWFHVDAAYAGTAALLPEKRGMLDGIELVDSYVFNPHKWMLTNFDCSVYFARDPGHLIRTFEIHPEYLKTGVDAEVKNFKDWGIHMGRRFRALKLWFVLRHYGQEGLQAIIREHIRLAGEVKNWVENHDLFELMAPVPLSLVCFRVNDGRDEGELNELNKQLLERLNRSGKLLLSHTTLRGKYVIRMVIGARLTGEKHVRQAWEFIRSTTEEMVKK